MNAREEINMMVKRAGWVRSAITDFLTQIYERQNREWRREHGLPPYPFTTSGNYSSVRGAAQAVADANHAASGTPWKYKAYSSGKRVTF